MTCYKVVRRALGEERESATMASAQLLYRMGVTTRPLPGDGPLAVFSDRAAAEAFIVTDFGNTFNLEIWLAVCRIHALDADDHNCLVLWHKGRFEGRHRALLPRGTRLARAVRLIKRVVPE